MDIHLLNKFYQGKCSAEEKALVIRWLEEEEQDEDFMQQLADHWEEYEELPNDHDAPAILKNIQARIQAEEQNPRLFSEPTQTPISIRPGYSNWLRAAAILIVGLGIGWASYQFLAESMPRPSPQTMIRKDVESGQKLTVNLSDGTQVILNAESTLTYPEKFSTDKREVVLVGEAFFDVARDSSRPFTIKAQDISVTVLGTSFNVNAYEGDSTLSVAVATGQVKVDKPAHQTYFLEPGKELKYQPKLDRFEMTDYDKMERLAWKEGILYFKDASLPEVAKTLERWYGVDIVIDGDYGDDWLYSGVFERQSLENVLEGMSYVQHFDFEIDNKHVIISQKK
uniref:DUF4974 domain-containing protein n=1 Tax=Roseihalotalea indica TaxID=2867963 RepID=A0AA49GIX2_9BACT|nr:DUF4974 domain-containing protein [Tunicatimonas sp. TK19036]